MRALTGIKPTATPHLGNLLGAIGPALELQDRAEAFYFIADYHALTTVQDAGNMRRFTREVAATWLALGLDPARTCLFVQSDIPEVTELTWLLSCVLGAGALERAHAFKSAQQEGREVNVGTFLYPVLMAADILIYDSNAVPVGKDQKQHVEMARDMAQAFNSRFGEVFVLPEPLIADEVATIPGLDGRKMSKSYGNTIEVWLPSKQLRKKVMSITTDSRGVDEVKDPDACNVFALYKLFASSEDVAELAARYRAPGLGYGHAKEALFQVVEARLGPARDRYEHLLAHPEEIDAVLDDGTRRARTIAADVLGRAREAAGFGRAPRGGAK
jgi:tryptophanyl-tRNA synthetase